MEEVKEDDEEEGEYGEEYEEEFEEEYEEEDNTNAFVNVKNVKETTKTKRSLIVESVRSKPKA